MDIKTARKMIETAEKDFKGFQEQALSGFRYYQNEDDITKTGAAAIDEVNRYLKKLGKNPLKSADNRIPMNRHRLIVDQKIGYLFTYPPQISAKEESGKAAADKMNAALGEDYAKVIKQLGLDASNTGRGWLHYWYDEGEPFQYWYINPLQILPVYDSMSVKKPLKYIVRKYSFVDGAGNSKTRYELWDDREVAYLEKAEEEGAEIEFEALPAGGLNIQPHYYGEIPFIEFQNNGTATNDLNMYKAIVDAVDKLVSGYANDVDDLQEIIWVIKNYAGETLDVSYDKDGNEVKKDVDLLKELKAKKWVSVDDKGGLEAVHGEIPYEARSAFFDILIRELYISAMAVNPSTENTGNQSGVYISFLYSLLELKAGLLETEFRSAIAHLARVILKYLGEPETMALDQTWTRNLPRNDVEAAGIIAQTPDTVLSDETKTKNHPMVDDYRAERERIEAERKTKEENMLDWYPQGHGDAT